MSEDGKRKIDGENVYTRVVVAAREARRLNALRLRGGMVDGDGKVTTEAIRRTTDGEVDWEIEVEAERENGEGDEAPLPEDPSFDD